ncbi:MAG: alpha-ketoacid dehydrogenase subunit beta [Candidatus Omnitrophota bacterium]
MRQITYREALREALREEMERDPSVFLIGEDIGIYGGVYAVTKGLLEEFGEKRVLDTPISEAVIVGAATGAAAVGTRPVAEIMYINFMTFCMDQIVNQAAKMRYMFGGKIKVPLVIRTQGGAGTFCAAQHSESLESWFIHIPGLKVVMPSTPYDAKGLLKSSIRDDNVVIFIEHTLLYNTKGDVPEDEYLIPLGSADIKREGKDVTIISYSRMVLLALEAADELAREGISAEIIDLRTLSPLDIDTLINSVKKTGRVVICEADCKTGGMGAEILSQITERAFDFLDAPPIRIAGKDTPIPYSSVLEKMAVPDKDDIVKKIREII